MKNQLKQTIAVSVFVLLPLIPFMIFGTANLSKGYHNYESLSHALKQLANDHHAITKLTSIGQTIKGRNIWMLQITGNIGSSPEEKQALLICGNAEGDHVIGSEVALNIAQHLLSNYGKDKKVTEILDKRTFYIIPRLNPDGAEYFFGKPLLEHPGNLRSRDDDYDWQEDEDGPEDLNKDGMITLMRVKDKEGEWSIDSKDDRLMKKKEPGTPADQLYKIFPEGIDNDGDKLYNEDGVGGFNINRNFPHNFGYRPKGSGVYPASEKESQALLDFMTRYIPALKTQPRRNTCGILLFSKYDNLAAGQGIECGQPTFPEPTKEEDVSTPRMRFQFGQRGSAPPTPQSKPRDPQARETDQKDLYIFKKISNKYKEITGIKHAVSIKPVGSVLEWGYFQFGVPTFSASLWSLREEDKKNPQTGGEQKNPASSNRARSPEMMGQFRQFSAGLSPGSQVQQDTGKEKKWLEWIDKNNNGKGFVKWQKFQHKQLGEVEIGGFEPYQKINPPIDYIKSISKNHVNFALYLASQFAEIQMDTPEINKLSSNLFEIKVKIHNRGELPYCTAMGQKTGNISPIMVQIKFDDDKGMKLFDGSNRYDLQTLDAGAEKEYKWIIISPANKKANITLWARNGGGKIKKQIILK